MKKVLSNDGTQIAYDRNGTGPAVILVDGALCFRSFGPMAKLSELLSPHFTVYHYDRRGRGDSRDTQPYAVAREVEDIEALIDEAGGSAFVFGTSSGACLALEAAIRLGEKVRKLAMYEAPYTSEGYMVAAWQEYTKQLAELLSRNCRGDAAAAFMKSVGTPDEQIEGMKHSPIWPVFESVAPTLAYDAAVLGEDRAVPVKRAAQVNAPALVMNGTTIPFMLDTAQAIAKALPNARHRTLEGQSHDVNLEVLAPVLVEFFTEKGANLA
jgi:pimeloyl-ACP methyl ester carboxylesterase